jgi:CBS domain containing-hemolysin-like protein
MCLWTTDAVNIIFFDINQSISECRSLAKESRHSRYPLCEGSLDIVLKL